MRKKKRRPRPTEYCPHCGEDFPAGRKACPHCGSDAETGWADAQEIEYQSVEIPDFYDDDTPTPTEIRRRNYRRAAFVVGMALALLAALLLARLL